MTRSFIALGSPAAAFSKFAHKPKPMRLGKRAANRNPTQIVREADINLCLRYQELLSYRTMRRIRKAAALSNGMVHSTGFGLSTEENVGLATQRAFAKVIERGIKMVITDTYCICNVAFLKENNVEEEWWGCDAKTKCPYRAWLHSNCQPPIAVFTSESSETSDHTFWCDFCYVHVRGFE